MSHQGDKKVHGCLEIFCAEGEASPQPQLCLPGALWLPELSLPLLPSWPPGFSFNLMCVHTGFT